MDSALAANATIAFAQSLGRTHPFFGAWPTKATQDLFAEIAKGERKIDRAAQAVGRAPICAVNWDAENGDPFFNINHKGDLEIAERRL